VTRRMAQLQAQGQSPLQAMNEAGIAALEEELQRIAIPKRFSMPMREIWDLQVRLTNRRGKRAEQLLADRRFRAAYDFLLLREASGEDLDGLGQWWTEFQAANPERQAEMQAGTTGTAQSSSGRRRRAKPRRRKTPAQDRNDN